jgi:hypothetical protein
MLAAKIPRTARRRRLHVLAVVDICAYCRIRRPDLILDAPLLAANCSVRADFAYFRSQPGEFGAPCSPCCGRFVNEFDV